MELQEYQTLAMRTAKQMDVTAMLAHGAMGCMTEAGEFAYTASLHFEDGSWHRDNALEELGDGLWFANYMATALGTSLLSIGGRAMFAMPRMLQGDGNPHSGDLVGMTLNYCAASENVGTPIKAYVYYGKPLDEGVLQTALAIFYKRIMALAAICGFTMSQVAEYNIAKLKKRYPEKYTDAAAIERADKADEVFDFNKTAAAMVGDTKATDNRLFDKAVQLAATPAAFPFPTSGIDVIT